MFRPLLLLLALAGTACAIDDYQLGADSQPNSAVPHGEVLKMPAWENSKVFPGTRRDWWLYIPAQYNKEQPANVMVFCDGSGFVKADGQFRAPVVFDNLIAKKEMPVTIGIFLNPGTIPATEPGQKDRSNRSFEYDSLGDTYVRFLLEEVIPKVRESYSLTEDAKGWAICGNSSGGIAAFTAAWERPDKFSKVISHIGSFTNIRGGYVYPALIRQTKGKGKPIRVFLQDGSNDLDNLHGNWPLSNQDMAAALKFAGYDHKFILGDGGHSGKHGGSLFPETLRWIWSE